MSNPHENNGESPGAALATRPQTAVPAQPATSDDQLLVYGQSEEGDAYHVLRKRNDELQLGQVRALRDGQAINGEVVHLKPSPQGAPVYNVDVLMNAPAGPRKGPARVTSEPYRRGWEAIFGPAPIEAEPTTDPELN